jgi:hypothetical protein
MPSSFCQLCGQPISRGSKFYHHTKWPPGQRLRACADCQAHKPRCRVCKIPMTSLLPGGVCSTCIGDLQVCRACGEAIPKGKRAVLIEGAGTYCESCSRDRPACDVCGGSLTDERWLLSDGRVSCAHCHATAIYTPQEAAALFEQVKNAASALGLN